MADADLIARISVSAGSSPTARDAITASRHYVPPSQPSSPQMGPYDSREPTPNPPDNDPYIELRFSSIPRSSYGFLVGRNPRCDIVLPNLAGLSHYHFSITFDDHRRLVVKDLYSTTGTKVVYNTRVCGVRRGFQWIIGGDRNADDAAVIIGIHHDIRFRILDAISEERLFSPAYMGLVDAYRCGVADASMLFRDLDLKMRQDTERPTGAQTPGTEALYLQKDIGKGVFGVVTLFWNVSTAYQHVVKSPAVDRIRAGKVDLSLWQNEAHIMRLISEDFHPHIVQFLGATFDPYPQLSFEFVPLGSLDKHNDISKAESYMVLCQCLSALTYLHGRQPPIVHRDIKPANILVQCRAGGHIGVKLGDFGMSRDYDDLSTICGTRAYLAPEIYANEHYCQTGGSGRQSYTAAVDIWSLGVVVYELTSCSLPRWKPNYANGGSYWCQKILDTFWQDWQSNPSELHGFLLDRMLVLSPSERDPASVCLKHALLVNMCEDEATQLSSTTSDTPDRLHSAAPPSTSTTREVADGNSDDDDVETIVLGPGSFPESPTSVFADVESAETESSWPTPQASPRQTRSRGGQSASVISTQPRAPTPTGSILVQPLVSLRDNDNLLSLPASLEEGNNTQRRHSVAPLELNKSSGRRRSRSMYVSYNQGVKKTDHFLTQNRMATTSHQSTGDLLFDKPGLVRVVFGRQEVCMRASGPCHLNASQMLDAANITKYTRDAVMRVLKQRKVVEWEGSGRRRAAWVPFCDGVFLCRLLGLEDRLRPLLHHARMPLPQLEDNYLADRLVLMPNQFANLVWNGMQVPYNPQERIIHIAKLLKTVGIAKGMVDAYLEQNPDIKKTEVVGYGVKGKYISYDNVRLVCGHFESQGQGQAEQCEKLLGLQRALSTLLPAPTAVNTTTSAQKIPAVIRKSSVEATQRRAASPPAQPAVAPTTSLSRPAGRKAEDGIASYFTEADYQHGSYLAPAGTSHMELLLGGASTPTAQRGCRSDEEKESDGARESGGYAAWFLQSSELACMRTMATD